MKRSFWGMALVGLLVLSQNANANEVNVLAAVSNVTGASIKFDGAYQLHFQNTESDNFSFQITRQYLPDGSVLLENLKGTFNATLSASNPGTSGTSSTLTAIGASTFAIYGDDNVALSGTVDWKVIRLTSRGGGDMNFDATANLIVNPYSGTNDDLKLFAKSIEQAVFLNFTLQPPLGRRETLQTLLRDGNHEASYSGTFSSAVPVPATPFSLASLALVGAVVAWRRRKIAQ